MVLGLRCSFSNKAPDSIVPLKQVEYGVHGDLPYYNIAKAIFHLVKVDFKFRVKNSINGTPQNLTLDASIH